MIFDTDILIWIQRGNKKAAKLLQNKDVKQISIFSYMELLQCAKDKTQQVVIRNFLHDLKIETLPLTENIGHRAAVYIDMFSLSHGLRACDALIAATAVENSQELATSNKKHFQLITELQLKVFKP